MFAAKAGIRIRAGQLRPRDENTVQIPASCDRNGTACDDPVEEFFYQLKGDMLLKVHDTSPGNAKLRALLEAGATTEEFVEAGRKAVAAKAGFSYALAVVENSRKAAATMASQLHQGALPAAETAYQRSMRERMAEVAPDFARKAPGQPTENATDFFNAIDVTARTVELLK